MSLKIEVFVPEAYVVDRSASTYLSTALSAIGFFRGGADWPLSHAPVVHNGDEHQQTSPIIDESGQSAGAGAGPLIETPTANPSPTSTRERGKPGPGRARRTKEEIAEDEAADKRDAEAASAATQADLQTSTAEDVKPAISTGAERVGPEDSAEDQAQDALDEKAETDAKRDAEKPLTHDDVRTVLGEYVKAYGMAAAQEDGPRVIALMFGEGKAKVTDIPDDQASLAKAVDGVREMIEKNPYKRKADL